MSIPTLILDYDRPLTRAQNWTALFLSRVVHGLVRLQGSPRHSRHTTTARDRLIGHLDGVNQHPDWEAHRAP